MIDFALTNDLAISNTFLKNRPEHLITYESGNRSSQKYFMLYRRHDRVELHNCKVIPGDHVETQQRLVTSDLSIKVTQKRTKRRQGLKKIKWLKLKDPEIKTRFKECVLQGLDRETRNIEDWWSVSSDLYCIRQRKFWGRVRVRWWKIRRPGGSTSK